MFEIGEIEVEFNEGKDILFEFSICVLEYIYVGLKDVNLLVDILLVIVKNCEYLVCYMFLKDLFGCCFD